MKIISIIQIVLWIMISIFHTISYGLLAGFVVWIATFVIILDKIIISKKEEVE